MSTHAAGPTGPDFGAGQLLSTLSEGEPVLGRFGEEAVLLVRRGDQVSAVGATCTHYSGPLAEGLVVGDTIRCPWHHACFSLRTGEAIRAPAFNSIPVYTTAVRDDRVFITGKKLVDAAHEPPREQPHHIVIIGSGAAGAAAADMLRRLGYANRLTLIDPDRNAPYDRPNLSKDYLAGNAPEEWLPLWPDDFCDQHNIERVHETVQQLDRAARALTLSGGTKLSYDVLLLATGATPRAADIPGADASHVHVLRSLADSRSIISAAAQARAAVVLGASFIGLEVAASLRARGLAVTVVAPENIPFARLFGDQLGAFVRKLHEQHGVQFELGKTAAGITPDSVKLSDGTEVAADLVVVGIGVAPALQLAETAGLQVDRGVVVNEYLQTSDPAIYAAGDIARWPDVHTGERIRVEHWVVAERQGQAAARNMLGAREPFTYVPFFWSQHYDVAINYLGHAATFDAIESDGDPEKLDYSARLLRAGRELARITIFRDKESLEREAELEASVRE